MYRNADKGNEERIVRFVEICREQECLSGIYLAPGIETNKQEKLHS
jgi:hypothetical protein